MPLESPARERYVLDACALIAYFSDESGAQVVADLLERARLEEIELFVASVNIYELYYDCLKHDATVAQQLLNDMHLLPVTIVEILDDSLMHASGQFKVAYRVSLADSIALGLAQELGARLVSSDHHEFDAIDADQSARFCWIR